MAHIAVYLQRTPQGLHPGSAVALCWARDIGSARGATVTAVCAGDAGERDQGLVEAAGRFGADVLLFCGPDGLPNLRDRLNPVHVLVPWTAEGRAIAQTLPEGPITPRWIERRSPPFATADAITGVVAGVLPWHSFEADVEAEYEGNVDDVPLPAWMNTAVGDEPTPVFQIAGAGDDVTYIGPESVDRLVTQKLEALGATRRTWDEVLDATTGTTIVLTTAPLDDQGMHERIAKRSAQHRILVLPGPDGELDPSWSHVDWVLPGRWPHALGTLLEGPWVSPPR